MPNLDELLLQCLLEHCPDHIYFKDRAGRYLRVNQAKAQRLGLSDSAQAMGKTDFDFYPEAIARESCADEQEIIRTGAPLVGKEGKVTGPDGRERWGSVIKVPVWDREGRIIGTVGISRDITERKRREADLLVSEARFRAFMDHSPALSWIKDEEGRYLYVNRPGQRFLGRTPDQYLGKTDFDLWPTAIAQQFRGNDCQVLASGRPLTTIEAIPGADGGLLAWQVSKFPFTESSGRRLIGGVAVDLTAAKLAERALKESEQRWRSLVEMAVSVIVCLSPEHRILEFNPEAERLYGRKRADVLGQDYFRLFLPETAHEAVAADIDKVLAGEPTRGFENAVRAADGSERTLAWNVNRLLDASGRPTAIIAVGQDVTERKRVEAERAGLAQRLIEAQEAERRRLARELHDEVGQQLSFLRFLLKPCADAALEPLQGHLTDALSVLDDLLGKVRTLSSDLRPALLDHLGLLPALLWLFERYTGQTAVAVDFKHFGINRRFAPEVETTAYRIVQEALTNVARHAAVREAAVRLWTDPDWLSVQIEDRGAGFDVSAALIAAHSAGLAGIQERVTLLRGRLTIDSEPERGTCLIAQLPLGDEVSTALHQKGCEVLEGGRG